MPSSLSVHRLRRSNAQCLKKNVTQRAVSSFTDELSVKNSPHPKQSKHTINTSALPGCMHKVSSYPSSPKKSFCRSIKSVFNSSHVRSVLSWSNHSDSAPNWSGTEHSSASIFPRQRTAGHKRNLENNRIHIADVAATRQAITGVNAAIIFRAAERTGHDIARTIDNNHFHQQSQYR